MNTDILNKVEQKYLKSDQEEFNVGDTITVHNIIREGEKSRIQKFKGVVIARKGSGTRETFTIRKISDGIGVEKIFPIHSPNIDKIEIEKRGSIRRAKLYYLRKRIGKSALKVKQTDKVALKRGTLARKNVENPAEKDQKADVKGKEAKSNEDLEDTTKEKKAAETKPTKKPTKKSE
jgi:large subunit ribosomal protein L19